MKNYRCSCGNTLYFENSQCLNCKKPLGFIPEHLIVSDFIIRGDIWVAQHNSVRGKHFRPCQNYQVSQVCNWMVPADETHAFCISCRHNRVIPNLSLPKNILLWSRIEQAKRRCLYTLLRLKLPFTGFQDDPERGLAFEFMEDIPLQNEFYDTFNDGQRILIGHINGTITINIAEADPRTREEMREKLQEIYRTLLGHFRHEIGHYYWMRLIEKTDWIQPARELFGDERLSYSSALSDFYRDGPRQNWPGDYISGYASAHPWEDWAETWAHYMHMIDTLETAEDMGVTTHKTNMLHNNADDAFTRTIQDWQALAEALNALNRSLGLTDAYPFYLSAPVVKKLQFIHQVIVTHEKQNAE